MNHTFKTIWNRVRNLWVCVAETVNNHTQGLKSRARRPHSTLQNTSTCRIKPRALLLALSLALSLGLGLPSAGNAARLQWVLTSLYDHEDDIFEPTTVESGETVIMPWNPIDRSTALYVSHRELSLDHLHLVAAGNQTGTYAALLDLSFGDSPTSLTLTNSRVEGDISNYSNLTLGSGNTIRGAIQMASGSTVTLADALGTLYRQASDPTPIDTPPIITFEAIPNTLVNDGVLNIASTPSDEAMVLDLAQLNSYSTTGVNTVFNTLNVMRDLTVVNTLRRPGIDLSESDPLTVNVGSFEAKILPTVNIQSHQGSSAQFSIHGRGVVKFDGGETLNADYFSQSGGGIVLMRSTVSWDQLAYSLDRNTVLLGEWANLALPLVGSAANSTETSAMSDVFPDADLPRQVDTSHSITMEDPSALWSEQKPYWSTLFDLPNTVLTTVNDVEGTLTQSQLSHVGALNVLHGTVTLGGSDLITTPIIVSNDGQIDFSAGTQVDELTIHSGVLHFPSGRTIINKLGGALPSPDVLFSFDEGAELSVGNLAFLQEYRINFGQVLTHTTGLADLNALMTTFKPRTLITKGNIRELPADFNAPAEDVYIAKRWVVDGTGNTVADYPSQVTVLPDAELALTQANQTHMLTLTNSGKVTLSNADLRLTYVGEPSATLTVNFPSKTSLVPCIAFAGHSVTTFSAKKRESLFD